jgi:hypothetical protein
MSATKTEPNILHTTAMSASVLPAAIGARRIIRLIEQAEADCAPHSFPSGVNVDHALDLLRTGLPFVPRILLAGTALNFTEDVNEAAVVAMITRWTDGMPEDLEDEFNREQALYLLGMLVGAELAACARPEDGARGRTRRAKPSSAGLSLSLAAGE